MFRTPAYRPHARPPGSRFFDHEVLEKFPAPDDARRAPGKRLAHEDLSALIIEHEVGEIIGRLRRAPGEHAERDRFNEGEVLRLGDVL